MEHRAPVWESNSQYSAPGVGQRPLNTVEPVQVQVRRLCLSKEAWEAAGSVALGGEEQRPGSRGGHSRCDGISLGQSPRPPGKQVLRE